MSEDYSDRALQEIFEAAAGKSGPDRDALLDAACAGRPRLRAEVESLLSSLDRDPAFMAHPTVHRRPEDRPRLQLPTLDGRDFHDANFIRTAGADAEGPGRHIDRYKLLQVIGEGGFGVVYMAEQEHPVRRRVALKVIKPGMDSRQVIARFEAERQALAMMDHPNIAKVLDAGATESGRPYFVMELVGGVPITEYCDANNIAMRERLGLFVQVCQAVQHAHQKGIIHRDIKPSNVLVTLHDGVPVPKVIDFGIAKATQARLTEKTLFTEFRHMIGTPAYMSPEQAEVGGIDVDTRSDIYSLGVLLYELLTETTPFDTKALRDAAYGEIQRIIREVEPPKPSTRLASLGKTLGAVAAHRRTDPARLSRLVRGELDWIVMKCLEKDRTRRYDTVEALAADMRRYLVDDPVLARPPGRAYLLRKFARRHRTGMVIAAVAMASLMVQFWNARRSSTERAKMNVALEAELGRTRSAQAEAAAFNQFIMEMLDAADPFSARATGGVHPTTRFAELTVRDMLDGAAARLDHGAMKDRPLAEAAVRAQLGRTYRGLGLPAQAEAQCRRALDIRVQQCGAGHQSVAESWMELGTILRHRGDYRGAADAMRRAFSIRVRLFDREGLEVAESLNELGDALRMLSDVDGAERPIREGLHIRRKLLGDEHLEVADSWSTLGLLLMDKGDFAGAERACREALRIQRRTVGDLHPLVARSLNFIGRALNNRGDVAAAEKVFRDALQIERAVFRESDPRTAVTLYSIGTTTQARGDLDAAEKLYRESARIWHETHARPLLDLDARLAAILRSKGDQAGAAAAARHGAEALQRHAEQALADNEDAPAALADSGEALARLGQFERALHQYDRAIEIDPSEPSWWYRRACLRLYLGDVPRYREESLRMLKRFGDGQSPEVGERVAKACLLTPERVGEKAVLDALVDRAAATPADHPAQAWFQQTKGIALYRGGDFRGAVEVLTRCRTRFDEGQWHAVDFYLAMAQYRLGDAVDARGTLAQGIARAKRLMFKAGEGDLGMGGLENWLISQVARQEAERLIGPLP